MITILIPITFSIDEKNLILTLNSIRQQNYKKWNLIIGLNSSINININEIKNITFPFIIYTYDNYNKHEMMKTMLDNVSTEWIAFAEPGDQWEDDKLNKQLNLSSKYDIIGSSCRFSGQRGGMPQISYGKLDITNFLHGKPIIENTIIIKKELCKWNTKYNIHSDYKLYYNLIIDNYSIYNIPEVLSTNKIYKQNNDSCIEKELFERIKKKITKKYKRNRA